MPDKIITIDIDKQALTMTVDTSGFHGTNCDAIHKALEGSDVTVTSDVHKPEYYAGGNGNGNTITAGRG